MIWGLGPFEFFVVVLPMLLIRLIPWVLFVVVCVLAIRWFIRQDRPRKDPESVAVRRSLAEVLRSHRERCKMTQEFVAEKIGVSRQAVSKWESGVRQNGLTGFCPAMIH